MDSNLSGDVAAGTAAVVVQGLWRHRRGEAGLAGWWAGRAASLRSHISDLEQKWNGFLIEMQFYKKHFLAGWLALLAGLLAAAAAAMPNV